MTSKQNGSQCKLSPGVVRTVEEDDAVQRLAPPAAAYSRSRTRLYCNSLVETASTETGFVTFGSIPLVQNVHQNKIKRTREEKDKRRERGRVRRRSRQNNTNSNNSNIIATLAALQGWTRSPSDPLLDILSSDAQTRADSPPLRLFWCVGAMPKSSGLSSTVESLRRLVPARPNRICQRLHCHHIGNIL